MYQIEELNYNKLMGAISVLPYNQVAPIIAFMQKTFVKVEETDKDKQ